MRFYGRANVLPPFRVNNMRKCNRKIHLKRYKEKERIIISRLTEITYLSYTSQFDSRDAINLRLSNNQVSRSIFINYIILILSTGEARDYGMRLDKTNQPRPCLGPRMVSLTASGYDKPSDKNRGEWLSKRAERLRAGIRERERKRENIGGKKARRRGKKNVKRERRSRPN